MPSHRRADTGPKAVRLKAFSLQPKNLMTRDEGGSGMEVDGEKVEFKKPDLPHAVLRAIFVLLFLGVPYSSFPAQPCFWGEIYDKSY